MTALMLHPAQAQTTEWTGTTDGDWDTASNWTNGVPVEDGGGDDTFINFNMGNFPEITASGNYSTDRDLRMGTGSQGGLQGSGNGRLDHLECTLDIGTGSWVYLGYLGGTATYNLADTSASGGTYTTYGTGNGTLNVGGASKNGNLYIGLDGGTNSTFNMNTTGELNAGYIEIAGAGASTGLFNLDAGEVTVSGITSIGHGGSSAVSPNGTFFMSGGTYNSGGVFRVGFAGDAGSTATATISGGILNVGTGGETDLEIARHDSMSATLNVTGTGVVNLLNGSDIEPGNGNNNSGARLINVDGGDIVGTAGSFIDFGWSGGSNTLDIEGGGTVAVQSIFGGGNANKTVNFNNGTLQAVGDEANFINFFGSGTETVNLLAGGGTIDTNGFNVTINEGFGGAGGLTKTNTGTLTLTGASSYSGNTTLTTGSLAFGGTANSALGTGTLLLNGGTLTSTNAGASNYNPTISNNITAGGGSIAAGNGTGTHIAGNISGNGALGLSAAFNQSGLFIEGDNSGYTGTVTVTGANTRLSSANGGSAGANWVVNGNLQTNGSHTFDLGSLSGSGNISGYGNSNTATLSVGALNSNTSFSGTIIDNAGNDAVSGNADSGSGNIVALTKVGTGTLTLTGDNLYTGATTVSAGTLLVNGSLADTAVTVASGATLGGSGTIGGMTTNSGTLAPGNSPGILSFDDGLELTSTSIFEWELFSDTDALADRGNATSGYDAVEVTGDITYDGVFRVQLGGTAGDFFDSFWASSHTWEQVFTASGTTSGNFTSFELWNEGAGSAVTDLATYGSFSFDTVNGSLTWTAVPEPTNALAGLLIGAGLLRRRRRAA